MRIWFALPLILFFGYANAAIEVEKLPNSELIYLTGTGEASKVANRINSILFHGAFPPASEPETSAINEAEPGVFISSEVFRNDAKVIGVLIHEEGCAASCSASNNHSNFDAKTGQYIHVSSLFTAAGMAKVSLKLIESWEKQIREDAKIEASSDVWAEGCIENSVNVCLDGLVKECIGHMKTNYDKGTPYMGYDFMIDTKGMTFVGAYCTKTMSSYPAGVSYQEISEYLSEYGKSLFSENTTIEQPIHPYNQILDGAIGEKYKIKMYLFEPYPSAGYLEGWYVYTKHNKPITILGEYKDNTLTVQEMNADHQPAGPKIVAHPTKDGFVGHWEGDNKKLKFSTVVGRP